MLKGKMEKIDLHTTCLRLQQENELVMDSPATCMQRQKFRQGLACKGHLARLKRKWLTERIIVLIILVSFSYLKNIHNTIAN